MTMIEFKLTFADENGHLHHEQVLHGESEKCFAWLQGYLSGSNYMLMKIEGMEIVKELDE